MTSSSAAAEAAAEQRTDLIFVEDTYVQINRKKGKPNQT